MKLCSELPLKGVDQLPPPVIIRRKQILVRSTHPEPSKYALAKGVTSIFRDEDPESSESHESSSRSRYRLTETVSTPSINRETCSEAVERPKWRPLVKSSSSNGTPKVYVESDTTWSSCSYDRDQSFYEKDDSLRHQTSEDSSSGQEVEASTVFIDRICSLSSYYLQENDFGSEEREILIESARSATSLRKSRFARFGTRRTNGSFASLKDHCSCGSFQHLDVVDRARGKKFLSPKVSFESDIGPEGQEEDDLFEDNPGSKALTFRKKLAHWGKESKDLLVKSVTSANTLASTTMTYIKSPRAMSEHLLGQLEVPATPVVIGSLKVKGGSLRDGEKGCNEAPRQRWSSVRLKGGSTKSLLLENGGPQTTAIKGQLRKEVRVSGIEYFS